MIIKILVILVLIWIISSIFSFGKKEDELIQEDLKEKENRKNKKQKEKKVKDIPEIDLGNPDWNKI